MTKWITWTDGPHAAARCRQWRCTAGALLALTGAATMSGCAEEAPTAKDPVRPVRAMQVADSTFLKGRKFPGRARAAQEVELSFRVAGPLITLPVKVGATVKKGEVVARIDPRDFNVQVKNVQAQLQQAQATARKALADVKRLDGVRAKNRDFVAEVDYDAAIQRRDAAAANVNALRASVAAARDQLQYASLKAPFDGIVVDTYVENFEDVRAKQPIVRIVNDSRIEFVVNIPENLISLAPLVKVVEVEFDAFPGAPVDAKIKEIGREASTATRTYPVTLVMEQPQGKKILPGMAGNAFGEAPDGSQAEGVEVPVTAVFTDEAGEKSFVWIIDEAAKTVSRRAVSAGELSERGIRVAEGVSAGEWIVTAGVNYLREGQPVRLLEHKP
jgi:RND family efflux transporter MFP subunit